MKSMRPAALAFVLFAVAAAAPAFDASRGARIAVLDSSASYAGAELYVSAFVERQLCDELRERGFDAFEIRTPIDRLTPFDAVNADYYLEIQGSGGGASPVADASIGLGSVAVDLGLVVSHVATRVRLYDGKTLEMVRTFDLSKSSTSLVPIGIGGWSRSVFFSLAAPARWLHDRTAMRGIARDAATAVATELRLRNE